MVHTYVCLINTHFMREYVSNAFYQVFTLVGYLLNDQEKLLIPSFPDHFTSTREVLKGEPHQPVPLYIGTHEVIGCLWRR